jgi:Neurotransmitter-gated ion-channel ligand binding domain/Neurotransmitter-gated ion-channel transmembrane region
MFEIHRNPLSVGRFSFAKIVTLLSLWVCTASPAYGEIPPTVPTVIEVQVGLIDLFAIDSSREQFTANIGVWASWHDPRLANNESKPILLDPDEVWHPELQFIDQQRVYHALAPSIRVHPDGTVVQRFRLWGDFTQSLDLRNFPLDTQTIEIQLVAAGLTPDLVKFVESSERPSGVSDKLTISDWRYRDFRLAFSDYFVFEGLPTLASFSLHVGLERHLGYYILKIVMPLTLIICMSFLAFWVSLDAASTRYSIAITSMLTIIAYRFMIGGLLPKISYMTRLDSFVLLSTVMVFLTVLAVVIIGALNEEQHERALKLNKLARYFFPPMLVLAFTFSFFV